MFLVATKLNSHTHIGKYIYQHALVQVSTDLVTIYIGL